MTKSHKYYDLLDLVGQLLESERHPADHYCESTPTCPWCERGREDAFGYDASEIEHDEDCPWKKLVEAYDAYRR